MAEKSIPVFTEMTGKEDYVKYHLTYLTSYVLIGS